MSTRPSFKRVRFQSAYDIVDVDKFLASIEPRVSALRGPHAPLAEEIQNARFAPVRIKAGYEMGPVDEYLDKLARLAAHGWPGRPTFYKAALLSGYAPEEVDSSLDRIESQLREASGPDPVLAAEIRAVRFSTVRKGYTKFAVDQWLKELASIATIER